MLTLFRKSPDISTFNLKPYAVELPLHRLRLGVDNVRYDVYISPDFRNSARRIILELIIRHACASPLFAVSPDFNWSREIAEFKRLCSEISTEGINTAKSLYEIQIDYLAQTALVKFLTEEIENQYQEAIQHFKTVIRKQEIAQQIETTLQLREEMTSIIHQKNIVMLAVGGEIFQYFLEVQQDLKALRVSNFGESAILPEEVFANPLLRPTSHTDGVFLMENYVLLGHRLEDPVNYNSFHHLLVKFFMDHRPSSANLRWKRGSAVVETIPAPEPGTQIEAWIKHVDNIDQLFNGFQTRELINKLKKGKAWHSRISLLKKRARLQDRLLGRFYKKIKQEKMIDGIVAAYKVQPVFQQYCPPLSPQECLQYLVVPKARKSIIRKLSRFKKYYGKSFSLALLNRTIKSVRKTPKSMQKRLLIRFLASFARYHRDLSNFKIIRDASDSINLTTDDRIIKLSRDNHTLYEFLLSYEEVIETKPIINHVVIKADIRGSSEIVAKMKDAHLNPASSFSLNFFDPIGKILSIYGAAKIFIEGDAAILAIFEHDDMPSRWYGTARACGLAINIINIVKKYNVHNLNNNLPSLELGIGIGFADAPPTFFYDGDHQIMISPAINVADQLSGCNRTLRERLSKTNMPFNVYLFRPTAHDAAVLLTDCSLLRYNVKGIELAPEGFAKLSKEIHLKRFECRMPDVDPDPLTLYTGTYPTLAGNYQRLVIREALIPEISTVDFSVVRLTDQAYYEVCTNPRVYENIKGELTS
jgi:hypothetical protein